MIMSNNVSFLFAPTLGPGVVQRGIDLGLLRQICIQGNFLADTVLLSWQRAAKRTVAEARIVKEVQ